MNILLTGNGDLASAISQELGSNFKIAAPTKEELNVSSKESVEQYFENYKPDIVVNLAGTLYSSSIVESEPEQWIRDINVNLIGTYLVCKFSIIKNKKVKIINIASTAAYNSYYDWTSYCSSKAGVIKISNGLSLEGYDVITICPGAIDTSIRDGLTIINHNVMEIKDGIKPIIDAVSGKYESGDIIVYRKGELEVKREI